MGGPPRSGGAPVHLHTLHIPKTTTGKQNATPVVLKGIVGLGFYYSMLGYAYNLPTMPTVLAYHIY